MTALDKNNLSPPPPAHPLPAGNTHPHTPMPAPDTCPQCGAPVTPAPLFDSCLMRGWKCSAGGSLHFWQTRAAAFKCWLTGRRYLIPPAPAADGCAGYPGVTVDDFERALAESLATQASWHAEGYDPAS